MNLSRRYLAEMVASRSVTPLLSYEEICNILNVIAGQHDDGHGGSRQETITVEQLKNPSADIATIAYQRLVDCSHVSEHVFRPRYFTYPVMFQDAVNQQVLINGANILARMHGVEFGVDDLACPEPKRFRRMLSHFINYCRFEMDTQNGCDEFLDQRVQKAAALDELRVRNQRLETDVEMARGRNEEEETFFIDSLKACEQAKYQEKEKESRKREADEQCQSAEKRMHELQQAIDEAVRKREDLKDLKEECKMQVADSPEAVEASMRDLERNNERHRTQKKEKHQEKQNRASRLRDLGKYNKEVETHIGKVKELLKKDEKYTREKDHLKDQTDKQAELKNKLENAEDDNAEVDREITELTREREQDQATFNNRFRDMQDRTQEAQRKIAAEETRREQLSKTDIKNKRQRDALMEEANSVRTTEQFRVHEFREDQQKLVRATQEYKIRIAQIFSKHKSGYVGGA